MIRLAILISLLLLTACSLAAQPTVVPASTPATPTLGPTRLPATPRPVGTVVPRPTAPAATPALTPGVPPPANRALEAIVITQPLVTAAVVSPVHVEGEADPTFEQTLAIHILDVEGRVVGQGTAHINANVGQRGPYSADISFNVENEEPGRIIVYSTSARDGHTVHLNSVEVKLKPSGSATPGIAPASTVESIVIASPAPGATVTPTLTLSGEAAPTFEQHLSMLIRDATGNVIGTGSTTINADAGQRGPFSLTLTYTTASAGPGRIVVYDTSPRDGGIVHLASVEVMLSP